MPSTCTQPNRCRLGYLTHIRVVLNFAFRARSKLNRVWDQTCSARLLRHLIFHRVLIGRYTNTRRSNVQAVTSPKSNFASHRPWHVWSLARLPRSARVARPFSPFFSLRPSPFSPPSPRVRGLNLLTGPSGYRGNRSDRFRFGAATNRSKFKI